MPESNITLWAVERQIEAMGAEVFDVGLFKPDAIGREPIMLPRVWDREGLMRSVPWLRYQNRDGRNIYVRPSGEHNLTLLDDLKRDAIREMKRSGFAPALVVETSPGNFQAWVKHPCRLDKDLGTGAARWLAQKFGGDAGAADWRHYGRLGGFANRKARHQDVQTGLYPFVKVVEASGQEYPAADRFLGELRRMNEDRLRNERDRRTARISNSVSMPGHAKSIDAFRMDPRYGGDGKRADLAYAVYAFAHGQSEGHVEAAIRSRDLSHKGNERRQNDYVQRTIKKALAASERGHGR